MNPYTNPLEHVKVAAPCSSDWNRMLGSEQVRFCEQCSLNVYNLSSMSKGEAESLIMRTEGRLCVRFYRRADGSILTENCPVGLRALKRRASRIANATVSALLTFLAGVGVYSGMRRSPLPSEGVMGTMVARPETVLPAVQEEINPPHETEETIPPAVNVPVMGTFAYRPPQGNWVKGEMEDVQIDYADAPRGRRHAGARRRR